MGKKKAQKDAFVLDGSVAIAWCFEDEVSPYADAVAARIPTVQAVVPAIWPLEVANVLPWASDASVALRRTRLID